MTEHENHLVVHTKAQMRSAILAGAYPSYEIARANPFSVRLEGSPFAINFDQGLHERDAKRIAARMARIPAKVFSTTNH